MIKKIHDKYHDFAQVLAEGHYHSNPPTLWSLLFPNDKKELPHTPSTVVGKRILGTSKMVGNRFLWGSIFALLSIKTLMTTAVGFATAGIGLIGLEYARCRQLRKDVITEVNFAGQKVEGTRADLCRLHQAQMKIMNLQSEFKRASMESTSDTIRNIIAGVQQERSRIKILERGKYGASESEYHFSRPFIKLVGTEKDPSVATQQMPDLRKDWATSVDVVQLARKLEALHRAMPEDLRRKVDDELSRVDNDEKVQAQPMIPPAVTRQSAPLQAGM